MTAGNCSHLDEITTVKQAHRRECEGVNTFLSNLVMQVSEIAGSVQRWSAATRASQPQPETS